MLRHDKKVVGDYVITNEKIGRGRFGVVYKGYHAHTHEPVAAKIVKSDTAGGQSLSEVIGLRRVNHPRVIRLFDQQKNEMYLCMVLEYCAGGDLEKYMKGIKPKLLPKIHVRRLFAQLCEGLQALAEHNILHRDLKPENIFLTSKKVENMDLKIADLGFAKHTKNLMAESSHGTPMWMAPERIKETSYDFKSELWAAGAILFWMLTGRIPFEAANNRTELVQLQRACVWKAAPEFRALAPIEQNVVAGLLAFEEEKRPTIEQIMKHPYVAEAAAAVEEHLKAVTPLSSTSSESAQPAPSQSSDDTHVSPLTSGDERNSRTPHSSPTTKAPPSMGAPTASDADGDLALGSEDEVATPTVPSPPKQTAHVDPVALEAVARNNSVDSAPQSGSAQSGGSSARTGLAGIGSFRRSAELDATCGSMNNSQTGSFPKSFAGFFAVDPVQIAQAKLVAQVAHTETNDAKAAVLLSFCCNKLYDVRKQTEGARQLYDNCFHRAIQSKRRAKEDLSASAEGSPVLVPPAASILVEKAKLYCTVAAEKEISLGSAGVASAAEADEIRASYGFSMSLVDVVCNDVDVSPSEKQQLLKLRRMIDGRMRRLAIQTGGTSPQR